MSKNIRTGNYVKTADGTVVRVTYVHDTEATVENDDGEYLLLPLTELRRTTDPRYQRIPVSDMPAERPRCVNCNRPFQPNIDKTYGPVNERCRVITRKFAGWNSYNGRWCTRRCSLAFANAAFNAGYRIVRKP